MIKHYIDSDGKYLGGFFGTLPDVENYTEVETPPSDYRQVWDGEKWSAVPKYVPQVVSRFQARAALLQAGILELAETYISNATPLEKLAWNDAQEFRRTSPTVKAIAVSLGLSDDDLDNLFIEAEKIEA